MIQAVKQPAVEQKVAAAAGAKTAAAAEGENLLDGLVDSLEGQDFANELAASMGETGEVKPVEMAADQMIQQPSALLNGTPQINLEQASPKVFDQSMTKGVEALIDPSANVEVPVQQAPVKMTDEQVLQLAKTGEVVGEAKAEEAKAEITQAMLKTPQVQSGRAPAIDFAKAEIDPQLLNMEDFVAQKNAVAKKAAPTHGYGMKVDALKVQAENGLKQTEVVTEIGKGEGATSKSVNSQQFILDMMKEQSSPKASDVQHVAKVFDMGNVKSADSNQIMNQITDYIVQAKAAKEPTVNMRLNHEELGMIDITVRKGTDLEAMTINIGTHSVEGKNFFTLNSKELASHLSQAGLSVSDIKVETPSQTAKNDFDMNQQSSSGKQNDKNFGSEQNQRRHEQDRRKELWNLLNGEAA